MQRISRQTLRLRRRDTGHGKYHSRRNIDEWVGEYHIRSVVESVFSSIKRCFGPDIKSIKGWLKRRELAIKVLAYNIKRMLYIKRAKDLGIPSLGKLPVIPNRH